MPKTFQQGKSVFPGPKADVVQQVELWMLGVPPVIPLTVHIGVPIIVLVAVTAALYVAVGVPVGARRNGKPLGLGAHPHFDLWLELLGLAKDGVAYASGLVVGHRHPQRSGINGCCVHAEGPVVGRPPIYSNDKRLSKRERQRQIEESDARVALLLADEQARSRPPTHAGAARCHARAVETFESRGRHQSQATIRVRGFSGEHDEDEDEDDDGDLALNLDAD